MPVGRDPPHLVFREQLGGRTPFRLLLEIEIAKLLPVGVPHDKAGGLLQRLSKKKADEKRGQGNPIRGPRACRVLMQSPQVLCVFHAA